MLQSNKNHQITPNPLFLSPQPPQPPSPKKKKPIHCPTVQLAPLFFSPFTVIRITKALKWLRCDTVLPRLRANVPCNTSLRERVVNSLLLKLPPGGKNCAKWEAVCIRLFFFRWKNCEKINSKYSVCCVFVVC